LKILLVGPFPPPHGGVSVHVAKLQELLLKAGTPCRVLNIDRSAPASNEYVSIRGSGHFMFLLLRYSIRGWSFHAHINGHNLKSWLVALAAGISSVIGRRARGSALTIHSGMAPAYLNRTRLARCIAWATCGFYRHIVAVNSEVGDALRSLPVPDKRIQVLPAFFPTRPTVRELPKGFESWSEGYHPVLSTALFFRPEYGFALLGQAITELRRKHPRLGCVVMGDSESRPEGLPHHMFAIGDLPHESCLAVIARSDIFVRPTFSDADAVSVREAIALGTPVVASDVVHRPEGTLYFRTGDAGDLASKIDSLIFAAGSQSHAPSQPDTTSVHRLLALYSTPI
jgi:glycogen(starch) synthase